MNYRKLGKTGLKVSEIAIGCEGFESGGYELTKQMIDFADENGINLFDLYTSNSECIQCGQCQLRCPFGVKIKEDMKKAVEIFGY